MHPLDLLIIKLASQSNLEADDRQAILALPTTTRTMESGSYLVREGERPKQCGIIVSGFAYRHKFTAYADRQINALHIPGDPLDFQNLFLDVADHNVQTLTRTQLVFISHADLERLIARRPRVAAAILVNVLVEASILREWLLNIGRRNGTMRLAHLLCEMRMRLEAVGLVSDAAFELPITQEQLGDALAFTPVHVNRMLRLLEQEGLIFRTKRVVGITDWDRLREHACFNDRYLHLGHQAQTNYRLAAVS